MTSAPPAPLLVVAETLDDYAVSLGTASAGRALRDWTPVLVPPGESLPEGVETVPLHGEIVSERLFARDTWRAYQRLWYRWLAPRDFVAPMRWYLAGLAGRSGVAVDHISERTDLWLQEQSALSPVDRVAHVRALLETGADAGLVGGSGRPESSLAAVAYAAVREWPFVWLPTADELAEAVDAETGAVMVSLPSGLPEGAAGLLAIGPEVRRLPDSTMAELSRLAARVEPSESAAPAAAGATA